MVLYDLPEIGSSGWGTPLNAALNALITIGAGAPGSELFTGRIAQVILCTGVLSDTDQGRLAQWAGRYGIE